MKKLFTVSLVAIMAVSAAHADIASTGYVDGKTGDLAFTQGSVAEGSANLTDAVNAVAGAVKDVAAGSIKLTAASAGTNVSIGNDGKINVATANGDTAGVVKAGSNVTIADGVISVAAPGAGLDVAALENADFVANVSEKDGKITATAGNFQKSIAVDQNSGAATNASATTAPTTAAITGFVESYVGTQMGVLDKSVTDITDMFGEGISGTEGNTVADKIAAVSAVANAADTLSKANQTAIGELDGTYATDTEVTTAFSDYTTEHSDVLNSGITAAGVTQITTNKNDIENLGKNKQDKLTSVGDEANVKEAGTGNVIVSVAAANGIVTATKGTLGTADITGLDTAINNKQDKSTNATSDYMVGTKTGAWQALNANLPAKCGGEGVTCALISVGGNISWEVVAQGTAN